MTNETKIVIDLGPTPLVDTSEAADELEASQERMEQAFRELALMDLVPVNNQVVNALAAWTEHVALQRPELNQMECALVAHKLLIQRLRCYLSQTDRLLLGI